jgi:hypothetical protein
MPMRVVLSIIPHGLQANVASVPGMSYGRFGNMCARLHLVCFHILMRRFRFFMN